MSDIESELREVLFTSPRDDFTPRPAAEDALDAYDRKFLRKGARFEVPLLNRFNLRDTAAVLAGLARDLDMASRRPELSDRQVLFDAKRLIWNAQQKILELRRGTKEL